jgi:hypothetical protein
LLLSSFWLQESHFRCIFLQISLFLFSHKYFFPIFRRRPPVAPVRKFVDKCRGLFFSWSPIHTMIFFFCINLLFVLPEKSVAYLYQVQCVRYILITTYCHQQMQFFLIKGPSFTASMCTLCSVFIHRGLQKDYRLALACAVICIQDYAYHYRNM